MTTMGATDRSHASGVGLATVLLALLGVVVVTMATTAWWVGRYVYAKPLAPTTLSEPERRTLERKMARIDPARTPGRTARPGNEPLEPTPYTEDDATREIRLSERELNGLVARDEDVARRVAIDLADDLVSVTMLVPFAEDFPILGGKTLRIATGVELAYADGKPIVAIRGISLGGIPLPKAWWGDIKGKNLIEEFGEPGGFWDQFSKGVDGIRIREGELWVQLRE